MARFGVIAQINAGVSGRGARSAAASIVLASLAVTRPVLAGAPVTKPASPSADQLFVAGKVEASHHRWKRAAKLFERAWQARQSYDIAGNLGQAELMLGHQPSAARYLAYCLTHFPATGDPAKKRRVQAYFARVRKEVAELKVKVDPAEAELAVDGTPERADVPLFVAPGTHTVEARAPGFETASKTVDAKKGETASVALELIRSSASGPGDRNPGAGSPLPASGLGPSQLSPTAPAGPAPPRDRAGPRPPLWPVWIGAGVAAAGLATGIGFTLAASSKQSDADRLSASLPGDSACGPGSPYPTLCAELKDANGSVSTDRAVAIGGFVVGGAAAVFSVGYLIWRGARPAGTSASGALEDGVRPVIAAGPGGATFSLKKSF